VATFPAGQRAVDKSGVLVIVVRILTEIVNFNCLDAVSASRLRLKSSLPGRRNLPGNLCIGCGESENSERSASFFISWTAYTNGILQLLFYRFIITCYHCFITVIFTFNVFLFGTSLLIYFSLLLKCCLRSLY